MFLNKSNQGLHQLNQGNIISYIINNVKIIFKYFLKATYMCGSLLLRIIELIKLM